MTDYHLLKCAPAEFEAVLSGLKTAEFRKADRDYLVGDYLLLVEHHPIVTLPDPRAISAIIMHIQPGGRFGIPSDHCMLSIAIKRMPPDATEVRA